MKSLKNYLSIIFFIFTQLLFTQELYVAQEKSPITLDVHNGNDGYSLRINRLLYSRLIEKNYKMENIPGIAKKWKIISPKKIKFEIFEDIYFHNGKKLEIEDIIFSFERMKRSPKLKSFLPAIKNIEKIDEKTFIMNLEKDDSSIIDRLTHPALGIVSREENLKKLGENPIGTGPYKINSYKIDEKIILDKFDKYFKKNEDKKYEKIIVKVIPLASNRTIALETGEVDIAFSLPVQDKEIIEKNEELNYVTIPSYSYSYLGLNLKKEKLKELNIRQGIELAINKKELLDVVLNEEGVLANTILPSSMRGYNEEIKNSEFNPKKATEILKDKNLKLTLAVLNNGLDKQISQIIKEYLKNVGVEVEINILEPGVYWSKTNSGEYDMFIGAWGSVTGEGDYALYPRNYSKSINGGGNRTFISNKKLDELLELARKELDLNKKDKIYKEIQEIVIKTKGDIPLFYRNLNMGISKDVKEFNMYPIPIHDYSLGYK